MKLLLSLEDTGEHISGSKGKNLSILKKKDFPVPNAFIVSSEIYKNFIADYLISIDFDLLPTSEQIKKLPEIQLFIINNILPDDLSSDISELISILKGPFAVRSSCSDEDGRYYSFAGIYNSILDLSTEKDMEEAIKNVWASLWSHQAYNYRLERGLSSTPSMAVVIQKQINSLYSGVVFTKNPFDFQDEIIVSFSSGNGLTLVSGENIPSVYILKKTNLSLEIKEKNGELELKKELLDEIILQSLKIETMFGCPQDIEWAWDGTFHILQARPVTTGIKWTRDPLSEFTPETLTPLSADFYKGYFDKQSIAFHEGLGIERPGGSLVFEYRGRLYINEEIYNKVFKQLYDAELLYGNYFPKIWNLVDRLPFQVENYHKKAEEIIALPEHNDLCFLMDKFEKIKDLLYNEDPSLTIGYLYNILNDYYQILLPEELLEYKDFFYNIIPTEINENYTFQQELIALFHDEELISSHASPSPPPIMMDFINKYGYRTDVPMEFARQRYRENYGFITSIAKSFKNMKGIEAMEINMKLQKEKIENVKKEYKKNSTIDMSFHFNYIIENLLYLLNERERNRTYTLFLTDSIRNICLSMGELLVSGGYLKEREDIFYLQIKEIEIHKKLDKYEELWSEYVSHRKSKYEECCSIKFPCKFTGSLPAPVVKIENDNTGSNIKGFTLNKGITSGRCRVMKKPEDLEGFSPGEIIVISSCDPFWSIVFPIASGLISETGGTLAHGAILAREYNIPAVSGIKNATEFIKTGDNVILNGDEGWIKIVRRET